MTPTPRNPKPTLRKQRSKRLQKLRQALAEEQKYICCYCEQQIDLSDSHLEHFRPTSTYPDLDLEYENLLLSCQANLGTSEARHCGHEKDDWFDEDLMVSPLQKDCEDFFEYDLNGDIYPTLDPKKHQAAQETIIRLALNNKSLKEQRRRVINEVIDDYLSPKQARKLAESFARPDDQGQYQPFCSALIYLLTTEYPLA